MRKELRKCFIDAIQPNEKTKVPQSRRKVPSIYYGEALTSDEVIKCPETQERQRCTRSQSTKKGKERTRQGKKKIVEDENHCQLCGAQFKDGEEDSCLGCDKCWRWVHCYCTGFDIPPDTEEEWLCQVCQQCQ